MTSTSSARPVARIGGPARPIHDAVASARSAVGAAVDATAEVLDDEECRALLVELTALSSQVTELELRVLARADGVRAGQQAGASSTATWLALKTGQSTKATHARARLARAVTTGSPQVRAALAAGEILPAHARAILEETAGLHRGREDVVGALVRRAAGLDASELRVRAREVARTAVAAHRDDSPLALVAPVAGPGAVDDQPGDGTPPGAVAEPPLAGSATPAAAPSAPASVRPSAAGEGGTGHPTARGRPRASLRRRVQGWWGRQHGAHRRSRGPSAPTRPALDTLVRAAHGAFGWHVHLAETCPHEGTGRGHGRLAHPRA
ncbi:hypothetical protein [Nocardioides dongxiaopingii]|uniref:hypothetical protein n=1 Tax=Nocardioides dongxiaopingii TaxID=2576036 RepID=UPI0010C76D51|nr:hypothetical protein [Nocardioides dongxiaopingii]